MAKISRHFEMIRPRISPADFRNNQSRTVSAPVGGIRQSNSSHEGGNTTKKRRTKSSSTLLPMSHLPPISITKLVHAGKSIPISGGNRIKQSSISAGRGRTSLVHNPSTLNGGHKAKHVKSTNNVFIMTETNDIAIRKSLSSSLPSRRIFAEDGGDTNENIITRSQDAVVSNSASSMPRVRFADETIDTDSPVTMNNNICLSGKGIRKSSALIGLSSSKTTSSSIKKDHAISVPGGSIHKGHRLLNGNCPLMTSGGKANDTSSGSANGHSFHQEIISRPVPVGFKKITTTPERALVSLEGHGDTWARQIASRNLVRPSSGLAPDMVMTMTSVTHKPLHEPTDTVSMDSRITSVSWVNRPTHKTFAFVYDESVKKSQMISPPVEGAHHRRMLRQLPPNPFPLKVEDLESSKHSSTGETEECGVKVSSPTTKNIQYLRHPEYTHDKGMRILKWILSEQTRKITEISSENRHISGE